MPDEENYFAYANANSTIDDINNKNWHGYSARGVQWRIAAYIVSSRKNWDFKITKRYMMNASRTDRLN